MFPRHARCVLSRLRCNGHRLLLDSYLSRIGRIENPSCSACGHSSQDISHLILHCLATDCLRRSLFGDSLSLHDLWSRPWRVARLLGLHGFRRCSPSLGRGRVTNNNLPTNIVLAVAYFQTANFFEIQPYCILTLHIFVPLCYT